MPYRGTKKQILRNGKLIKGKLRGKTLQETTWNQLSGLNGAWKERAREEDVAKIQEEMKSRAANKTLRSSTKEKKAACDLEFAETVFGAAQVRRLGNMTCFWLV